MAKQDAPNYQKSTTDQVCETCRYGQFGQVCTLYNFRYDPSFTCDSWQPVSPIPLTDLETVDLKAPHGFLIWKGKETAIASDKPLPVDRPVCIISRGEAFGLATLSRPAQMTIPEFEREEQAEKHCIRPEERELYWPEARSLYVQTIKEFSGFRQPVPVIDGHLTQYHPTRKEAAIIDQGMKLPKQIILDEEAVVFTTGGFTANSQVKGSKELQDALAAVFDGLPRFVGQKRNEALPLYQLALVRQPNLRFERILSRVLSAQKAHTGAMVAFRLPQEAAKKLALETIPEGEVLPPEELHLTLAYLGDSRELDNREMIEQVLTVFAENGRPLTGKVGGYGRFMTAESDGTNALYASFDSPDLPGFRQKLVERLAGIGLGPGSAHGFTPHITLAYIPKDSPTPDLALPDLEITFDSLVLAWGDEQMVYPLRGQKVKKNFKQEATAMPWQIEKRDGKECVIKIEDGSTVHCYDGPEAEGQAKALLAALNINVEEPMDKESQKAVTKTEDGMEFSRDAYLVAPDPEKVTTWKLRIESEPGEVTRDQLGAAAAALSSGGFRGQKVDLPPEEKQAAARKLIAAYRKLDTPDEDIPDHLWATADMAGPEGKAGRRLRLPMMEKLRNAFQTIQDLLHWAEYAEDEDQEMEPLMVMDLLNSDSGVAVKMVNGRPWHFAWSANSFIDRDEEIFSQQALENYVEENEANEIKGFFNFWHIGAPDRPDLTDFAEKRWQGMVGRFLVEAGPYLANDKGQAAMKFFQQYPSGHPDIAPEGWGSSVEYRYLPEERKSGVYNWVWITRTSTLPRGAAANIWTKSTQESIMLDGKRKEAATLLFGEEFVNQLVAEGVRQTEKLEQAGVAAKEKDDKASKVGSYLKKKRTGMEMTEKDAAEKAGMTEEDLVAIEAGDKMPDEAMLAALAKLYGVSVDELAAMMPEGEMKQAGDETPPVVDPAQLISQIAEAVAAKMMTDPEPLAQALAPQMLVNLEPLTQLVQAVQESVTGLVTRMDKIEQDQDLKAKTELPRFTFELLRASQAKDTEVPEGDALKNKKPEETKPALRDGSMASAFFPAPK